MRDFKGWIREKEPNEQPPLPEAKPTPKEDSNNVTSMVGRRNPNNFTKSEILDLWAQVEPNKRIQSEPIEKGHEGSTFGEDAIRLTGSYEFILSVLSHLKSLLPLETDNARISTSLRRIEDRDTSELSDNYSFYFHTRER